MQGVRDYIKYIKRGYTRPTHLASIDIRNDRMTREEGIDMIEQFEGKEPPSLEIFLELVGLTKDEFYKICESHTVSPWKFSAIEKEIGSKLPDFNSWSRDGKMDRDDAKKQLARWEKNQ